MEKFAMNSEFTLTLARPSTGSKMQIAIPEEFITQMEAVQTSKDRQELGTCIIDWIIEEFNAQWIPIWRETTGFPTA
jgi:hypothetical protein